MDIVAQGQAVAAATKRSRKQFTPVRIPIATRARLGIFGAPANDATAGNLGHAWRTQHVVLADADSLEFTWANVVQDYSLPTTGSREAAGPDSFLLFADLEMPDGSNFSIFPGGTTVQPGAAATGFVPTEVTKGQTFYVRTQIALQSVGRVDTATGSTASSTITDASITTADAGKRVQGTGIPQGAKVGAVTAGTSFVLVDMYGVAINPTATVSSIRIGASIWPVRMKFRSSPAEQELTITANPTTDQIHSASVGTFSYVGNYGYGPSMITGIVRNGPVPSVLALGHSVVWGVGSSAGDNSYLSRALEANSTPHLILAMPSAAEFNFVKATQRMLRMNSIRQTYFSDVVIDFTTNDLGVTMPSIAGNALGSSRLFAARGIRVWRVTCPPHTANVQGTTPGGNDADRIAFNNWLRAGSPIDPTTKNYVAAGTAGALLAGQPGHPITGYFEMADLLENSRNSGTWKSVTTTGNTTISNGTITGLPTGHPLQVGMALFGTGIPNGVQIGTVTANSVTLTGGTQATATGTGVTITGVASGDGIHPSEWGHAQSAALFPATWSA